MSEQDRLAEIKARRAAEPQFFDDHGPLDDIDWLIGEVERERMQRDYIGMVAQRDIGRLRALLTRLEWAGILYGEGDPCCLICGKAAPGVERATGRHGPGCELSAVLHPANDEAAATPKDAP